MSYVSSNSSDTHLGLLFLLRIQGCHPLQAPPSLQENQEVPASHVHLEENEFTNICYCWPRHNFNVIYCFLKRLESQSFLYLIS